MNDRQAQLDPEDPLAAARQAIEAVRSLRCPYCGGPEHYEELGDCWPAHVEAWGRSGEEARADALLAAKWRDSGWEELQDTATCDRERLMVDALILRHDWGHASNSILQSWVRGRHPSEFDNWNAYVEARMAERDRFDTADPERALCEAMAQLCEAPARFWRPGHRGE